MRRLAIPVVLALLALCTLAAAAARAGEYRVLTCTTDPAPTGGEDLVPSWDASLVSVANRCGDLRQVQVNARASTTFGNGRGGSWRLEAPAGTRLRRTRVFAQGRFADGVWGVVDVLDGTRSLIPRAVDAGGTTYEWAGDASALQASLTCVNWTGGSCATSTVASYLLVRNWDVSLDDLVAPETPSVGGPMTTPGWRHGGDGLDWLVRDTGSGVERFELRVDGQLVRSEPSACARSGAAFSRVRPCPASRDGRLWLDTAKLADGAHAMELVAFDAGGAAASRAFSVRTDNTAPARPGALRGPEGWRRDPAARLAWELPGQGAGAPVAAAWVKVGDAPARRVAARDVTTADVVAPGDGETPVRVWLEDEAGNADPATAASTTLRVDREPPRAAFGEQDPADPERVRLLVQPDRSGVPRAELRFRRRGESAWRSLPVARQTGEVLADLPDERLTAGVYELQAELEDGAGNVSVVETRADGRPAIVEAPLRRTLRLTTELSRTEVAQGERATLTATLREPDGRWTAGAPLRVEAATDRPGEPWRLVGEAATDAQGRIALPLPAGPSRRLRVSFAGSRTQLPAGAETRLAVRAAARLSATPGRVRNGRSVRLAGRLLPAGTPVPRGGKLIQVQFLERPKGKPARWRPMRVVRTDRHGRFAVRHRFRTIRRTTRITFRATVPAEEGFPWAWGASATRRVTVRAR